MACSKPCKKYIKTSSLIFAVQSPRLKFRALNAVYNFSLFMIIATAGSFRQVRLRRFPHSVALTLTAAFVKKQTNIIKQFFCSCKKNYISAKIFNFRLTYSKKMYKTNKFLHKNIRLSHGDIIHKKGGFPYQNAPFSRSLPLFFAIFYIFSGLVSVLKYSALDIPEDIPSISVTTE